jgi:hypothetical protein
MRSFKHSVDLIRNKITKEFVAVTCTYPAQIKNHKHFAYLCQQYCKSITPIFDLERNQSAVFSAVYKIVGSNKSISSTLNLEPLKISKDNFKEYLQDYGFAYIINHFCKNYSFELVDEMDEELKKVL